MESNANEQNSVHVFDLIHENYVYVSSRSDSRVLRSHCLFPFRNIIIFNFIRSFLIFFCNETNEINEILFAVANKPFSFSNWEKGKYCRFVVRQKRHKIAWTVAIKETKNTCAHALRPKNVTWILNDCFIACVTHDLKTETAPESDESEEIHLKRRMKCTQFNWSRSGSFCSCSLGFTWSFLCLFAHVSETERAKRIEMKNNMTIRVAQRTKREEKKKRKDFLVNEADEWMNQKKRRTKTIDGPLILCCFSSDNKHDIGQNDNAKSQDESNINYLQLERLERTQINRHGFCLSLEDDTFTWL